MATAGTNLESLKSTYKSLQDQIASKRKLLGKPSTPKRARTKISGELRRLITKSTNIKGKIVILETKNSNSNNNLKSQIQTPAPSPKKQKISQGKNNNTNKNANIEENKNEGLDSQGDTPPLSISEGSNGEINKDLFEKFMSWYNNNNNTDRGQPENDRNNQNILENPAPQDTEMTKVMQDKIITSSRTEELKEVQVYKGVKFSGVGTDKYIKAAEFMTSIRNFEKQGKLIFGFREDRAIRSIRINGFTDNAALMVAQAVPQAIETFEDFYYWFETTWDMSMARQELYNHFMQFKMPSNITPDELSQHIQHYKQIFDSVGDKCSELVKLQTTLKEVDVINVIYNSMCKEWQQAYDKICEFHFRPLNLDSFMNKLAKMTTHIIEYNATHTQQPIPLKSPTKSNVNKLYQQSNYSPNQRYNQTYPGKSRQQDARTFTTPQKQYKQSQKPQTKPTKTNSKTYKDPYYIDAWCPICGMGGHAKGFHWVMIKKYPNKLLEFANLYLQKRNKHQVNNIKKGEPELKYPKNESNQESNESKSKDTPKETEFRMTDTTGMMD